MSTSTAHDRPPPGDGDGDMRLDGDGAGYQGGGEDNLLTRIQSLRLSATRSSESRARRRSSVGPAPEGEGESPGEGYEGGDLLTRIRSTRLSASRSPDSPDRENPEEGRPASPSTPREAPQDIAPPPSYDTTPRRRVAHYAGLVLASMIGTLIRLGLDALGSYPGMVIYPLSWSQGVGCGIMGLALARRNEIVAIYPPLYTFLTTGIAGSVTTFSSWMLESYLSFSNFDGYPRSGLYDTGDGLAYSFSTFAISIGCLYWGEHVAAVLPSIESFLSQRRSNVAEDIPLSNGYGFPAPTPGKAQAPAEEQTGTERRSAMHRSTPFLDYFFITTAFLAYLIALLLYFLAPVSWRHRATFAILLSPPGAILRFFLANLNPLDPFFERFPLGTFLANQIATLVISGAFAGERLSAAIADGTRCNALYAIQQGFCGCLSTVSTFVVEARAIRRKRWRWIYILGSVVLGHVFVLAVVGGVGWTRGYEPVCTG